MTHSFEKIRQILMEMPRILDGGQNDLWDMYTKMAESVHNSSNDVKDIGDNVTMLNVNRHPDYNRQYVAHGEPGKPLLRMEFKDHSFSNLSDKKGSYASLVHKGGYVKTSVSDKLKKIYDHELNSNDYITSDANQYEGGKIIWKKIVKDFENEGKSIYIHDGERLTKVSHQDILNGEHSIWGTGSNFANTRLVVSNDSLS
jgi:hypothetical protein